ncbi:cutinase transcription factor 1 alpha [Purpureocillium lavendulum]|uniref:Cutinase transcription factor 1 alpha n=1 Tax=Purpureocillium lavendulum TaxID=1247861 RepID=A0AB34FNX7_9HYPO|nr:cutinase transcription factor 1 alpha [Purpureocillium lavendulum]
MATIRRKPVAAADAQNTAIRRKPIGFRQAYRPAPQDDEYDDLEQEEDAEFSTLTPGPYRTRQYDPIPHHGEIDLTDVRRSVSPLRPSEEEMPGNERPYVASSASSNRHVKDPVTIQHSSWLYGQTRRGNEGLWTPLWLTKTVLVIFVVVFCLMLLATALLFHFSQKNHGIGVQKEVNHYGWKYGPTALLVVVGALWRQVDHANKILIPWKELRYGPTTADKSLLLDYVSPILPTSLWMALRNRHWAVAMSILGHLLILGTTVFSTGLLILEPTVMSQQSGDFRVKSEFKLDKPFGYSSLVKIGPAAAQLYYGINFHGLRFPQGTSNDILIPALEAPREDQSSRVNFTTSLEGIQIGFDCEMLPITNGTKTYMPWRSILGQFFIANISTPDCKINGVTIGAGPDHGYFHQKNATQNYQAQFDTYPCNVDWDFSRWPGKNNASYIDLMTNSTLDQRILMSVTDLRFPRHNASHDRPDYLYIRNITAALCKPSYRFSQFDIQSSSVLNGSALAVTSPTQATDDKMKGLSNSALGMAVLQSAWSWKFGTGGQDYVLSEQVPTFFQLMTLKSNSSTIGDYMDRDLLIKTGSSVFKGIATQVLHLMAVQPVDRNVTGEIQFTEDRLKVKALSTGFMCSFLGLLVIISAGMIFARPHSVAPHEPGSLAATAAILASSPGLQQVLANLATTTTKAVRQSLSIFTFRSDILPCDDGACFSIHPSQSSEGDMAQEAGDDNTNPVQWWRPVAGTNWFLALAISLPLLIIAALEIIQHFSDTQKGFVDAGPRNALVLATYIPAAAALGVASMYAALELAAAVFAPYVALKRGSAPPDRSIYLNLVGKLLPIAMFSSLKARHFAVAVALLSNFIGGFLTILVSGLYSASDVPLIQHVGVQQLDTFNLSHVDFSLSDNQASAIDSLIEFLDLDYTQWTYDSLAFNRFNQSTVSVRNASANAPLNVNVPATRAVLNCTSVPAGSRQITKVDTSQDAGMIRTFPGGNGYQNPQFGRMYIGFNTTLKPSDWCDKPPPTNSSDWTWMQYFNIPNTTNTPAYIGKASSMIWKNNMIWGDGGVNTDPTSGSGMGASGIAITDNGCPSFAVTLGMINLKSAEKVGKDTRWNFEHAMETLVCYQHVEEVKSNVTWHLPGFQIDTKQPPIPDESTKRSLKTEGGSERFPFAVNSFLMALSDAFYNKTIAGPKRTSPGNNDVDKFVNALVNAKNGQAIENLIGPNHVRNLTEAANRLYGVYMAQAISLNMRQDLTDGQPPLPAYSGLLTLSERQRLYQNMGPKIALQAMLGTMVVCAIISRSLMRFRQVLPHDPCSIAGKAVLLTGADMATRKFIPPGEEWKQGSELRRTGVFGNKVYSLRWWRGDEKVVRGKSRYGIDVEGE